MTTFENLHYITKSRLNFYDRNHFSNLAIWILRKQFGDILCSPISCYQNSCSVRHNGTFTVGVWLMYTQLSTLEAWTLFGVDTVYITAGLLWWERAMGGEHLWPDMDILNISELLKKSKFMGPKWQNICHGNWSFKNKICNLLHPSKTCDRNLWMFQTMTIALNLITDFLLSSQYVLFTSRNGQYWQLNKLVIKL